MPFKSAVPEVSANGKNHLDESSWCVGAGQKFPAVELSHETLA